VAAQRYYSQFPLPVSKPNHATHAQTSLQGAKRITWWHSGGIFTEISHKRYLQRIVTDIAKVTEENNAGELMIYFTIFLLY
jgi:hypothetical protein